MPHYSIIKTETGYAFKSDLSYLYIAEGATITTLLHNLYQKHDGRYFVELNSDWRKDMGSSYRCMHRLIAYDESVCDIRRMGNGHRYVSDLWILLEDTGASEDILVKVKGFHDFMEQLVNDTKRAKSYCGTCRNFRGGGDFGTCCDMSYDLCYENTEACTDYEEVKNEH